MLGSSTSLMEAQFMKHIPVDNVVRGEGQEATGSVASGCKGKSA